VSSDQINTSNTDKIENTYFKGIDMELRHLRYFATVAELGSISRAAEKLFIAQPPLSAQIRQLEEEVGAPLLRRLPRGVALTPAGALFLEDARAILARSQQAMARARERHTDQHQVVRVGLMPSTTLSLLPRLVADTAQVAPEVRLESREISPSSRQLQALRNGDIDLGFVRPGLETLPPETLLAIDDPYCLVVPVGHTLAQQREPLHLGDAAHERFVGFSRYHQSDYFDQTAALCAEAGFRPDTRHEAGQFAGVVAMVACGLGVAIVPASCALDHPPGVAVRHLTGSRYRSRLVLIGSPQAQDAGAVHAVAAVAQAALQGLSDQLLKG
jgi:DNA-binding transcriptional LysR family regulator